MNSRSVPVLLYKLTDFKNLLPLEPPPATFASAPFTSDNSNILSTEVSIFLILEYLRNSFESGTVLTDEDEVILLFVLRRRFYGNHLK